MNSKRQTIWLVSMLSLMVILSAYYLFTGDVNKLDKSATTNDSTTASTQGINIDMSQTDQPQTVVDQGTKSSGNTSSNTSSSTIGKTSDANKTTSGKTDTKATGNTTDPKAVDNKSTSSAKDNASKAATTDAKIIGQVQAGAQTTTDYFSGLALKQTEALAKETDKWMAITGDANKTSDEIAKANDAIRAITEMTEKVDNIENELGKTYSNAIILQESGKFKVVVQSAKLQKSEAVSIMDLVIKGLEVGPEKIEIRYVP
jgi:stage III sporulation protein AH